MKWFARLRRPPVPLWRRGERLAARFLKRRGFRILHRNLTVGKEEADLVAVAPDGKTLVIVEVKTRADPEARPEEAIGRGKQSRLARLAARLASRPEFRGRPVRFDVVAVTMSPGAAPDVRHYEHAFESPS